MSTDIELTEVSATSAAGRRHSFSEAIEAGRQPPPSYDEAKDKEAAEETTGTTTAAATTTSSFNFKDSIMGVEDLYESRLFRWVVLGVLVLVGIGALLVVILVPLHFADLEYYQIGFRMQVSTGSVDTTEVFGPGGRYGIGVDYTFKDFPSDSHYSTLDDLSVFSNDRLELFLDVTFQYFIRPRELQPLHDSYDRQYNDIIISRAESVIKAVAPRFNTTQYFRSRAMIEQIMAMELFNDLGGQGCCDSYCSGNLNIPQYRISDLDCTGCLLDCPADLRRFNIDVRYFQLLQVRIPSDVGQQFLNNIILNENAEQEQFAQDAAVETLTIERDVQDIMNQATELSEEASANASLTRSIARANAAAIVEDGRTRGLALLYERLNITQGRHKASLDYIRTLRRTAGNVRLHVGFRDTISGPYNGQNIN